MKAYSLLLLVMPLSVFCQSHAVLEIKMHDYSQFVLELDDKQYEVDSEITISELATGAHQMKVYLPKEYVDPITGEKNLRLINVYNEPILISEEKCYSCTLNQFYQSSISLK